MATFGAEVENSLFHWVMANNYQAAGRQIDVLLAPAVRASAGGMMAIGAVMGYYG